MKEIILMAIRFYQATRLMRLPACRFYPSCSDYAQQAIEIHGALKGLLLALFRLSRCHPFTKGGTDFPPPLCHSEPLSLCHSESLSLCHSERSEESSAANLARRGSPASPNPVYTLWSP